MTRYSLNFDLHHADSEEYEKLENILHREFGNVRDMKIDSTFEFESDCENSESMKEELERLLASLNMTFTVTDLDHGGEADGETFLARFDRLSNY